MNVWDMITGNDMTREWKAFEARANMLPAAYQEAWDTIKANLWPHSDLTGRNLMPILDGVLGLLEETATDGYQESANKKVSQAMQKVTDKIK